MMGEKCPKFPDNNNNNNKCNFYTLSACVCVVGVYLAGCVVCCTFLVSVTRTEASESSCSHSPSLGLRLMRKSVRTLNTATPASPLDAHAGKNYSATTAILSHTETAV